MSVSSLRVTAKSSALKPRENLRPSQAKRNGLTKVEATPPPLILPTPGGLRWDPLHGQIQDPPITAHAKGSSSALAARRFLVAGV
jgi:hypothetical protein